MCLKTTLLFCMHRIGANDVTLVHCGVMTSVNKCHVSASEICHSGKQQINDCSHLLRPRDKANVFYTTGGFVTGS
jgi:hypothetical protein